MGGMEGYLIFAGAITLTVLGFVITLLLSPERRGTVWQEIVRQRANIIFLVFGVLLLAVYLLLGALRPK